MIIAAAVLTAAVASAATRLMPTTIEEMARYGATHVITVTAADLAASTNVAGGIAFTNTVADPCSVKFMAYVLDKQFQDNKTWTTNGVATTTNSITLFCGDGNSSNKWINAVQAAYDQTPTITGSFGTDYSVTCYATNGAAGTVTSPILNAQTSDVTLLVTVASEAKGTNSLSNMTRGQAKFYFKIIGSGWQTK